MFRSLRAVSVRNVRGDPELLDAHWPVLFALFALALALWAQTHAMVGVFFDDGIYVSLAKALAEGEGYRSIHLPGAPFAVHYPPLYPALLAVLWTLWPSFPANVTLFQLCDSLLFAGAAWVIAAHARRTALPLATQGVVLVLAVTAFPLLTLVGVRFSEPLFLLLLAGAIAVADGEREFVGRGACAGLLAGLATLARSIGVVAVVGIPVALWLRGRRRAAAVALAAGIIVAAPWFGWLAAHAGAIDPRIASNYGTYGQFAGQAGLGSLIAGLNLRALSPIPRLLLPALPTLVAAPLILTLVAMLVLGAVSLARRTPALIAVLVPYVVVVSLWPYTPDRFVWIILPWIALLGAAGAHRAWHWGWPARAVLLVLAAVVAITYGRREVRSLAGRQFAKTATEASVPFRLLTSGIASGTPEDAVLASDGEALVYLYTGRRTAPLFLYRLNGREAEPLGTDAVARYLCDNGVTHVAASVSVGEASPLLEGLAAIGDSTLVPLFVVTDGPALYRYRCPG